MVAYDEVDFDHGAANAAAAACDDAAGVLDARASEVSGAGTGPLAQWSGGSALEFDAGAAALAGDLTGEATRLRSSAEAIRRAAADARAEDDRRREAAIERERRETERREAERREAEEREAAAGGPR